MKVVVYRHFWFGLGSGLVFSFLFTTFTFVPQREVNPRAVSQCKCSSENGRNSPNKEHKVQQQSGLSQSNKSDHRQAWKNTSAQLQSLITEPPVRKIKFEDEHIHKDNDKIAKDLYNKVRVLCWIMTSPKTLHTKAAHVKATWGKRCNSLLFFSSETNLSFPVIGLNVSEGRSHLTAKTMQAFLYIYKNHLSDADWFMKADDDTYVIVENLRYMLLVHNSSRPIFFGMHFHPTESTHYNSGGAGYVLSKEALIRYGEVGSKDQDKCVKDGGSEDLEFGKCLHKLGVVIGNTTDALGRTRFHCFTIERHLIGEFPQWYLQYYSLNYTGGMKSISDYAISFHYVSKDQMYIMEFLVYHLRPYGIISGIQNLN